MCAKALATCNTQSRATSASMPMGRLVKKRCKSKSCSGKAKANFEAPSAVM